MKRKLSEIAGKIDRLLASDPFPENVEPEFLRAAVRDYPVRGGKRLRPALLIWSCELTGGDPAQALYPAAAVEVFHNWTLVHDDIIDQDDSRRGKPTCHVTLAEVMRQRFPGIAQEEAVRGGRDFAILAGDLQQGWANDLLLRSADCGVSPEVVLALQKKMQSMANCDLISGEALDVAFSFIDVQGLPLEQVRKMVYLKTGILLEFAMEAGAMIGLGSADDAKEEVRLLGRFARLAGEVFQLRDDELGIFGDPEKFGKKLGGDLREKKATVLLSTAFSLLPESGKKELQGLLGRAEYTQEMLQRTRLLLTECGALTRVRSQMTSDVAEAWELLERFPPSEARHCLGEVLRYFLERVH